MTAEGHLLFSIACAVFAKNAELTPVLAQGDWWHIVPSAILTCLLPDIDHPKSFLGQRLKWISKPIARAFGHRGFTHSLLAVFALLATFYLKVPESWFIPADTRRCSPALAMPLAFPLAYPGSPKGQPTGTFYLHGIICLVGMDAPFITRKQRCSLVIANDQYLTDPVSSAY